MNRIKPMPIETAETIYILLQVFVLLSAVVVLWYLYRNYSRDEVLSRPEVSSRGQLKNVVAFANVIMKNSTPSSPHWADAICRQHGPSHSIDGCPCLPEWRVVKADGRRRP
jgi:hypothetical protein